MLSAILALGVSITRAGEPEPPVTPQPPATPPAVAPAPAGSEEAKRLLEKQAQDDKNVGDEIAAQANAHFETGRRLFSAFEYEEARKELEMAVRLQPSHDEAKKLLIRVNDILSIRRDRIRSAVAQLYGEAKVAIQEKLIELDNKIDWGKRFISEAQTDPNLGLPERIRKYEQALSAFERARELIKYMPIEVNTDTQRTEVDRLIVDTRRAIKAAQTRLQETDKQLASTIAEEQLRSRKVAKDKKINTMVDQARNLAEQGKYEEAVTLSKKILEEDPINPDANTIIATSSEKYHGRKKKYLEDEYQEQFKLNRESADRRNIPHKDYLIYPDNWNEIARRSSPEAQRKAEDPWKQDIRKKIARKVSFEFVDTPLSEAIAFLNSLTKITIILDPRVSAEGVDKAPITLRVNDMEMELALKWILRLAELDYDMRNQAIFITKKANLLANVELEIYDIRDLTTAVPDFPGPRIDIGTATGGAAGAAGDPFAAPPVTNIAPADLQVLIKEKLLPAEFADPATSIEESGGKLIVMQRPEIHERIRQLLRSFRETQTVQVLTQVRFVDVTDGFLETIGMHFTGLDSAVSDPGVPNRIIDPLAQPSKFGLFAAGGGPGLTPPLASDVQSNPFQFANFIATPPFQSPLAGSLPPTILRPRLDPNFPNRGNATVGPAQAPVGIRRQWMSQVFGSPVLTQGLTQNLLRLNPLASVLGSSITTNPQQGAYFQFRFLSGVQTSAILQAVRKDQTADQLLAPKLMQFNNQRAHILVAQQRSYIKDYDVSGAVFDPVISSFLIGVVLEVKPTVSNDKRYITLDVRPGTALEITPPQIIFITNAGLDVNIGGGAINLPIELPNLELRSINTTVTIPDNGTMLFSGLISDRKIDAKSGVPLLSDLPIIGRFFSTNNKERVRRNLLVLINSRVVLFDEEEARL